MKQPIPQAKQINQPIVRPLPRKYRTAIFIFFVLIFIVLVPLFVFYAIGYRVDFFEKEKMIMVTGGLYISTRIPQAEIFLNDEQVQDSRIFRQGTYIQNVTPGVQLVRVQAPGFQTWVKKVPVMPIIVTEAESFLMPVVPQVRVITEYLDNANRSVLSASSTALQILETASSTQNFVLASTTLARTYQKNPEFTLLTDLFTPATSTLVATGTVPSTPSESRSESEKLSVVASTTPLVATTTIEKDAMMLFTRDDKVFVRYRGAIDAIPYYFCVPVTALASTSELFGERVALDIQKKLTGPVQMNEQIYDTSDRLCRTDIAIDTRSQIARSFYFLPNETDHVLIHTDEGVFVVEIDDRSWQNVQQVYPASAEKVVVDNNRIYIKEGEVYFELYTTLLTS